MRRTRQCCASRTARGELFNRRSSLARGVAMAITGTYGFVYCGANGLGVGLFVIDKDGRLVGSDYVGAKYEGTASESSDGTINVDISFDVPPGVILVQGTSPQDLPHKRQVVHT